MTDVDVVLPMREINQLRFGFMERVCRDHKMNGVPFRVAYLIVFKYWNKEDGCAWPGYSLLAEQLGCHKDTVKLAVKKLRKHGYIKVRNRWKKGGKERGSNLYYPNFELGDPNHQPSNPNHPPEGTNAQLVDEPDPYKPVYIYKPDINPWNEHTDAADAACYFNDDAEIHKLACVYERALNKIEAKSQNRLALEDADFLQAAAQHLLEVQSNGEKEEEMHAERVKEAIELFLDRFEKPL